MRYVEMELLRVHVFRSIAEFGRTRWSEKAYMFVVAQECGKKGGNILHYVR
jgi:hypothetical protein